MTDERWTPLRDSIDATENKDMKALSDEIFNDDGLHIEEKKAAIKYMCQLAKFRGFNVGSSMNANEDAEDEESKNINGNINNSYMSGYMLEGQEMNDAKNMLDFQRQRIGEIAADDMLQQLD